MTARRVPPTLFAPTLLALALLLASCRKPQVESYRVPKEPVAQPAPAPAASSPTPSATPDRPAPAGGSMANTAVATASGPGLGWTAPAHWKVKPATAMRKGSFAIAGDGAEADLSITAFPGDVGGDLANLNRWRSQLQLPPITEAELAANTQRIERNNLKMIVVDLVGTGTGAQRILGAMIPYGGSTWFVKLMGPDAIVAKEKPAFTAFLDTIKPAAP